MKVIVPVPRFCLVGVIKKFLQRRVYSEQLLLLQKSFEEQNS